MSLVGKRVKVFWSENAAGSTDGEGWYYGNVVSYDGNTTWEIDYDDEVETIFENLTQEQWEPEGWILTRRQLGLFSR
jgi:hypothetical protein